MRNWIVVLCIVFLAGCSQHTSQQQPKVFRYNQASGISSLDPAFAKDQGVIWACNLIFNSLVALDEQMNIVPSLARRWEISEDGLTYTFYLRDDVFFHNDQCFANGIGRKVTASDVVYSFSRLIDPAVASPGAWIFNGKVSEKGPFVAINDTVFQLRLKQRFPPLLGILSMQYCSILPEEAVSKYGKDFRAHPVGTGPFCFKKWEEGTALFLSKNSKYFERDEDGNPLPFLDGVKVSFMDNKKTEFLAFKQKQLDMISGIDAAYIDEILDDGGRLKQSWAGKAIFQKAPYLNTEYLGFYLGSGNEPNPFKDKNLRKAINYGINREEIIHFLRNGLGRSGKNGFVPYGIPSFDSTLQGYEFSKEKALYYLKKSAYKGQELKLYTNESYRDIAVLVCKQLESIGIKAKPEIAQASLLREWMSNGKVGWFRGSWLADYPDAENYFAVFYGKNSAPPNYTRYSNPLFDKIYEAALAENDLIKRQIYYRTLDSMIIEDAPVVVLYYDEVLRLLQPGITGVSVNAQNLLDLRRAKLP
ncbi:MAG: ABC transporter substrate-binding protein [Chitinophagales bacterium]|nr:ABC transporter substrate-binding protein [Chitinophagales bacterium]MDW8274145.1 ABC transporter substrate-binding protein [Chitinophagales bacterium]